MRKVTTRKVRRNMRKTRGCRCACHRQTKRRRNMGSKRYMRGG